MRYLSVVVRTGCMLALALGPGMLSGAADLDALAKNRSAWPREVTLKKAVAFPVIVGRKNVGEVELAPGETVALVEVLGAQIKVGHGKSTKIIPAAFTDLSERVAPPVTPAAPEPPTPPALDPAPEPPAAPELPPMTEPAAPPEPPEAPDTTGVKPLVAPPAPVPLPEPGALAQTQEFAVAHDVSDAIRSASEKARAATVTIPMGKGMKHGVIVDAGGYILTSQRAVAGMTTVPLKFRGATLNGKIVGTDPAGDLALIKISADKLPVVDLGNSDVLGVGDVVLSIGAPQGFTNWTATGFIVSQQTSGSPATRLRTTMIADGNSQGSPVVNLKGELVGIVTIIERVGTTYAVPGSYIKQFLTRLKGAAPQ